MIQLLTKNIIDNTKQEALDSSRKRAIYKFHQPEDNCQRMINVLIKGTYVQPHRHLNPPKIEHFTILEGKVACLQFNEQGQIMNIYVMSDSGPIYGVDLLPGEIHSLVCISNIAVLHEIIDGQYNPDTHKEFMNFAPAEHDPESQHYLQSLENQIR